MQFYMRIALLATALSKAFSFAPTERGWRAQIPFVSSIAKISFGDLNILDLISSQLFIS
jgi:hypothetical protein